MVDFTLLPPDRTNGDILLVNADFSRSLLGAESEAVGQLGLSRLATYLEAQGFVPALLDTGGVTGASVTDFAVRAAELASQFRVLGFQLTSWNISTTTEVVKKLPTKTRLLLGGPLASGAPQEVLTHFVKLGFKEIGLVQGYGELLTAAALRNPDWKTIPGLWTTETVGKLQRPTAGEIAEFPLLDVTYAPFVQKIYAPTLAANELTLPQGTVFQAFGLDVNHGCPFDCTYCSLPAFGRTVTSYTPARVAAEVEKIATETGIFLFTFTNSNLLFLERAWLLELLTEFERRGLPRYVSFTGYHHPLTANLLSVKDLMRLKAAGCHELVIGVQSVEPKIARLFHRPENSWEVLRELREKTRAAKLDLVIDYITGVPGEDLTVIKDFYEWCQREKIECRAFQLKIYPGTHLARAKQFFLQTHELVPITGELAPELESYAVLPKTPLPDWFVAAERDLRESNAKLTASRPLRLGSQEIVTATAAKERLKELPWETQIPAKVRQAQALLLNSMLSGGRGESAGSTPSPEQMLRTVVLADETASPIVRAMQERFRKEVGEQKFQELQKRFLSEKH